MQAMAASKLNLLNVRDKLEFKFISIPDNYLRLYKLYNVSKPARYGDENTTEVFGISDANTLPKKSPCEE